MSFVYSSPISNTLVTLTTSASQARQDFMAGVSASLVAASWTATNVFATSVFTFNGVVPSNTHNCVVGGKTYTFVTILTNVDGNVLIGADAAACQANLLAAITLGAGAGTTYAAATTANTVATAAAVTTLSFTATAIGATIYTNLGAACTTNGAISSVFGAWSSATLINAGQNFKSPENADDFGQFGIMTRLNALSSGTNIRIIPANRDFTSYNTVNNDGAGNIGGNGADAPGLTIGNVYRMISSPCSFNVFLPGVYAPDGTGFFYNAPAIPSFIRGKKISAASNATPVVYTTTAAHGYTTGQVVNTKYILGNTGANTFGAITVLSTTTFSIAGSIGTGAYTSGGICWNTDLGEVGEVAGGNGSGTTGSQVTQRVSPSGFSGSTANFWVLNGVTYTSTGVGCPRTAYMATGGEAANSTANVWNNQNPFAIEAWMSVGLNNAAAPRMVGQMRNAVYGQTAVNGDSVPDPFDSHTWIAITHQYTGASTQSPGTLYIATS